MMKAWIIIFAVIVAGVVPADSSAVPKTRVGQLVEYNLYEIPNGPLDTLATLCSNLRDSLQITKTKLATAQDSLNSALSILESLEDHIHSVARCYPDLANGVTLTGGAGTWELGTNAFVIPTDSVEAIYDLHYVNVASATAADTYQIRFYCGELYATSGDSLIGCIRTSKAAGSNLSSPSPIITPQIPKYGKVSASVASSSGGLDQIVISVSYHVY